MVWSVFNYLLTQKLPRKAKVALVADRCSQYKKLLKTLKVAQKLPSTIYLCLSLMNGSHYLNKVTIFCILEMSNHFHKELKILKMAVNKKVEITGHFLGKKNKNKPHIPNNNSCASRLAAKLKWTRHCKRFF